MQTIMIIAIYPNGDRIIAETPATNNSREWRAAMLQVGKSICRKRTPHRAIVINGIDVAEYNHNEVREIFLGE